MAILSTAGAMSALIDPRAMAGVGAANNNGNGAHAEETGGDPADEKVTPAGGGAGAGAADEEQERHRKLLLLQAQRAKLMATQQVRQHSSVQHSMDTTANYPHITYLAWR